MGLRHKSIRLRILLLVLVPLLSLVGVYAYATTSNVRTALDLTHAGTVANDTVNPDAAVMNGLAAERSNAVLYVAAPNPKTFAALKKDQATTDKALRAFEHATSLGPIAANASQLDRRLVASFISALGQLPALRANVASGRITVLDAVNQYSGLVEDGYDVMQQSIQKTNISQAIVTTSQQGVNLFLSELLALQESDLYVGGLVSGSFTPADRTEFAQLVGLRRFLVAEAVLQLEPASSAVYDKYVTPQRTAALVQAEDAVISRQPPRGLPPVAPAAWAAAVTPYATNLATMLTTHTTVIVSQVKASARATLLKIILSAVLGLLAIVFSIVFSILVGRGLISQLKGLRLSALELANDRLPSVIRRLREGESVDVAAETPALEAGPGQEARTADEIDQVQQAFNIVQRTAIEAAVDEANLRRGISDVFRNLARRSQVLLHRQLRLLDGMERRASEPEELEDLFRIDHLTTRMRRHAEGLIILSGEPAGRTWRHPVPLMDVLRAAVAEVEDYTRIRVEARTRAALSGTAVADVIHLIAELAENATVFSPPNTPVKISGDIVGRGFAVEIEDRGLGITEERLAEINRNLADPPAFDLSGSDRLGLFIAGRLAKRHDIKITLRPSVYGGTSAVVIIPTSLVVDEEAFEHVPALGADGPGISLGGRHAALTESVAEAVGPAAVGPAPVGNGAAGNSAAGNGAVDLGSSPSGGSLPWSAEASPSGQVPDTSFWNSPPAAAAPPVAASPAPPWQAASEPPSGLPDARQAPPAAVRPFSPVADWAELATGPQPAVPGADAPPFGADRRDARRSPAAELGDFGLPVRVRQASLAPQLREPSRPDAGRDAGLPSPEAARNTMAALQRGWALGRSAAGDPSATDAGVPPAGDND